MRFLHNFIEEQSASNLVQELDCFIDQRRTRVYRQFNKTEEYQKMAAESEKFRAQLRTLVPELFEQYEIALLQEQDYTSTHEYLQGILDGVALRNVFHNLNMKQS